MSVSGYLDNWAATFRLGFTTADGLSVRKGSADKKYTVRFFADGPLITGVETTREHSADSGFSQAGVKRMTAFVDLFCDTGSSDYSGRVTHNDLYDWEVEYFGEKVSKSSVLAEDNDWNGKWPIRRYERNGSIEFEDLKDRRIEASFVMAYSRANRGASRSETGRVRVTIRFRFSDDLNSAWIYYENSKKAP